MAIKTRRTVSQQKASQDERAATHQTLYNHAHHHLQHNSYCEQITSASVMKMIHSTTVRASAALPHPCVNSELQGIKSQWQTADAMAL